MESGSVLRLLSMRLRYLREVRAPMLGVSVAILGCGILVNMGGMGGASAYHVWLESLQS